MITLHSTSLLIPLPLGETEWVLPAQLNNPFDYEPHPLCLLAVDELCRYLEQKTEWRQEIDKGKMFGVLVVETPTPPSIPPPLQEEPNRVSFLAAYSGQILGRSDWEGFVPAVFDYLQPDGYFKIHEAEIDALNRRIDEIEENNACSPERIKLEELKKEAEKEIEQYKLAMLGAKALRDRRRKERKLSEKEQESLIRESQFQKAQMHRIKKQWSDEISVFEEKIRFQDEQLKRLKHLRKRKSDDLQRWLFSQFRMLNVKGEVRNLLEIFRETAFRIPPAGAGECCEPKLLQYAFANGLRPLCMAMFWWGESPKQEIRHHRQFYPACNGKCKPILEWMLKGVRPCPPRGRLKGNCEDKAPSLWGRLRADEPCEGWGWGGCLYEDNDIIVINKPSGMLSVPGKEPAPSVYSIIKERYPEVGGPLIVHRLDMATSGLLVLTKTKQAHANLQQQFANHTVKKRYAAVLDGIPKEKEGVISLPLAPDILDRPRQKVDLENGKEAITIYKVQKIQDGKTWISLFPRTGRTHQLRVHCAHRDGLSCPILGDPLYGKTVNGQCQMVNGQRLHLHAEYLEFTHPTTGERMHFEVKAPF